MVAKLTKNGTLETPFLHSSQKLSRALRELAFRCVMLERTGTVSSEKRSEIMRSVRSRGNKVTELVLLRILRSNRITGWRRTSTVTGSPDFVFPKDRVAVFVDGCFWHGCSKHCRMPKSNRAYWSAKIGSNRTRDRAVTRALMRQGWVVVRSWEHDLRSPDLCMQRISAGISTHRRRAH